MNNLDFTGLNAAVAEKLSPMVGDILEGYASNIHSFHVVGSAVIPDYNEKLSDINSVVVLHSMDFRFIEFLAPLGKKYGKKRIAAPLVMTPEYIMSSLDAFPVEFLDFKFIHKTVYGDDLLQGLELDRKNLRLQCEREVKTKLINARQGYISSLGKKEPLEAALVRSITGSMALFRAIIVLFGKEPPVPRAEVITTLGAATGLDTEIFQKLLMLKAGLVRPKENELHALFERYYYALESTGKIIDALHV
jgi:hypothetical protein